MKTIRFLLKFIPTLLLIVSLVVNVWNGIESGANLDIWGFLLIISLVVLVFELAFELFVSKSSAPYIRAEKEPYSETTDFFTSEEKTKQPPKRPKFGVVYTIPDENLLTSSSDVRDFESIPDNKLILQKKETTQLERFFITFRNIKRSFVLNLDDTKPIGAIISFYDESVKLVNHSEKPFWYGSERDERTNTILVKDIIIKASGEPVRLCLAARKKGDEHLYVFNRGSYRNRVGLQYHLGYEITGKSHYASIKLNAGNIDTPPFWFRVEDMGVEREPLIELIDDRFEIWRLEKNLRQRKESK